MEKTENQLKYENYREQFKRLNSALHSGFNLEAMFIEYAILEDRTESILRHAGKLPNAENADKWLGEFEDMVLQNRGYITRRESVFEALRKPIR